MGRQRRGFTIVELLVVIAVLVLLLAILLPSLRGARDQARTSACASNLRQLGEGYLTALADKTKLAPGAKVSAGGWSRTLINYLHDQRVLMCVQDFNDGPPAAFMKPTPNSPASSAYVSYAGSLWVPASPSDMVHIWCYTGSTSYELPIEENEYTKRNYMPVLDAAGLSVPADPNYYLCFEDIRPGGGDKDYNDIVLLVEPLPDGRTRITRKYQQSGSYTFKLFDDKGNIIFDPFAPDCTYTYGGGLPTSYGMNNYLPTTNSNRPDAVLLLDYYKPIANVAGPDALIDSWWADKQVSGATFDETRVFARHNKRFNAARLDGSVITGQNPYHLTDPNDATNQKQYWGNDLVTNP